MSRDWAEATLGDIATLEYGKPLKAEDRDGDGFPVYGSAGKVGLHSKPMINCAPVIVVGRKGTAGAVWWSDLPCSVIDTAFYVVPKVHINLRFLYLLLKDLDLSSLTAQTGVPGLNRDRAYSSVVKLPSAEEQARIVDLVAAVDEYIVELEGQADAARKARNAVLHEMLTAGGADWVETSLRDVASWSGGITPSMANAEYWANGTIPWISSGDVLQLKNRGTQKFVTENALAETTLKLLPVGTIVMVVRSGILAHTLPVSILRTPSTVNQDIKAAVAKPEILPEFLQLILQSNSSLILESCGKTGTTVQSIGMDSLMKFKFQLPPIDSQKEIIEMTLSVDDLIDMTDKAILKAKDLRTGLLSELLSGEREIPDSYDSLLGAA